MTVWLAIDTATDVASVAVHDGAAVLAETTWTSRRHHTVELAPRVDEMLRQHDLTATDLGGLAVAIGPGSYTGLRIGLALAKGLALATGIPIVPVPTLDILAAPLSPPHAGRDCPLWAVLRAGRGRLVAACYPASASDWPDAAGLEVMTVAELMTVARPPAWVAGELDAAARAALAPTGLMVLPPAAGLRRSGWLAELGRERLAAGHVTDAASLAPIYLGPAG